MFIIDEIIKKISQKPVLFTTPGHSAEKGILPEYKKLVGKRIFDADLSEIQGMDNLQNPSGIIKNSFAKAAEIYGSKNTFYLVNGSTSGIIALMLATVSAGDKVLVSRNIHKSVINALTLSGACPLWINPEWEAEWNIPSVTNPSNIKQKLDENPEIKAVWITSPTYEGIVSDVKSISKICIAKGVVLVVDEAHGALWNFSENLPVSSIHLGADACVQSLHKTGSCFTQGAVLHLSHNSLINPDKMRQSLNIINTTSPSYLILSSIEASIEYLSSSAGKERLARLLENLDKTKTFLSKNIEISFLESSKNLIHDPTKLYFRINGVSGYDLGNILFDNFNIEMELENNIGILALTGIGTAGKKLDRLAISLIKAEKLLLSAKTAKNNEHIKENSPFTEPEIVYTPAEAFNKKFERIGILDAAGRVSKETIVNYPPGIPIIVAGEVIKPEHIKFLSDRKEIDVIPHQK